MAGKREIKTTLSLDGEAEFKRAVSDASSALKQLNAEEKLAKAQFEATGNAQEYQAERARILKAKIEEQRKVVEKGEKALKAMRDKGVEPNNKAYQTLSTRVINARTRLVTMNTELDRTQAELGETGTALDNVTADMTEFSGSLSSINQGVTFQSTITAIDNISTHLESVVKTAGRAFKAVIDMEVDAGKWADELKTTSSQMGIDVETLQRWRYASRFIDTSVDTISQSMSQLSKKSGEEFERTANMVGLPIDGFKSNTDYFWAAIDAFHYQYERGLMTEKELDDAAQQLFGRGFRDLKPLIEAGSNAYLALGENAQIVSAQQVEALGAFDDARQDLEAGLDTAKYQLLAGLAGTFTDVANSLSSVVKSFNEFLASEEGQAALEGLGDALKALVEEFTGEDDFTGLVTKAKDAVTGLTTGLEWFKTNSSVVSGFIYTLAGAFGALKVSETVLSFVTLLSSAKFFRNASMARAFAGGDAAAAGADAAANANTSNVGWLAAIRQWAGKAFESWNLGTMLDAFTGTTVVPLNLLMDDQPTVEELIDQFDREREEYYREKEEQRRINELFDPDIQREINLAAAREANEEALASGKPIDLGAYTTLPQDVVDDVVAKSLIPPIVERAHELLAANAGSTAGATDEQLKVAREWLDWVDIHNSGEEWYKKVDFNTGGWPTLAETFGEDYVSRFGLDQGFEAFRDGIFAMKTQLVADMEGISADALLGFTDGIESGATDAEAAGAEMANGAVDGAKTALDAHSPSRVMYGIGSDAAIGLANGIDAQLGAVQAAAARLASIVADVVRSSLMIQSPSKVMAGLGAFTAQGFAEGISDSVWRVEDAIDRMVGVTQRAPQYMSAAGGATAEGGNIQAYIVMDKEIVGELVAPTVDGVIGATISARR